MDLDIEVVGKGPVPGTSHMHFEVGVNFDGPIETLTITAIVPDQRSASANRAAAIARAKELARLFAEQA